MCFIKFKLLAYYKHFPACEMEGQTGSSIRFSAKKFEYWHDFFFFFTKDTSVGGPVPNQGWRSQCSCSLPECKYSVAVQVLTADLNGLFFSLSEQIVYWGQTY